MRDTQAFRGQNPPRQGEAPKDGARPRGSTVATKKKDDAPPAKKKGGKNSTGEASIQERTVNYINARKCGRSCPRGIFFPGAGKDGIRISGRTRIVCKFNCLYSSRLRKLKYGDFMRIWREREGGGRGFPGTRAGGELGGQGGFLGAWPLDETGPGRRQEPQAPGQGEQTGDYVGASCRWLNGRKNWRSGGARPYV